MLIISNFIPGDAFKNENTIGSIHDIYLCNDENLLEKVKLARPSTIILSDSFLLFNIEINEVLSYVIKRNVFLVIVHKHTTFNDKCIRIDNRIIVIGNSTLSMLLKVNPVSFYKNEIMKQKVKKYSKKEYQVVKSLFSGVSIESICKEQSFQKKTFSTHIGNVKNKFGLQSKQQIYYLFLIQKRLKLIEYT